MRFSCDHCRSPLPIPAGISLDDVTCQTCHRPATIDESDRIISHYELLQKLGAGAYGTVWKGRDLESGRIVAIKIAKNPEENGRLSTHLLREIRLASQIHHPNIGQVYEAGREGEWQFIVSEYVEGETLSNWLKTHTLSVEQATHLCIALATALEHAHQSGVVHRDFKPSNIVVNPAGEPCIIDFGSSKSATDEVTMKMERYQRVLYQFQQRTKSRANSFGPVVGTPQYMSPEQAKGDALFVDHRSDVYSLGVVFYELLTGKRAFRGTPEKVIRKVLYVEPIRPRRLNRRIPRSLETVCLKSMAKIPSERYASAKEMADDCRRALAGEPILAQRPKWPRRIWRRTKGRLALLSKRNT